MLAIIVNKRIMEIDVKSEFIVANCIEPAMIRLKNKCIVENFNLLEVILTGRAVVSVMNELFPPGIVLPQKKSLFLLVSAKNGTY